MDPRERAKPSNLRYNMVESFSNIHYNMVESFLNAISKSNSRVNIPKGIKKSGI